ncbi:MAG: delta-aminolevulinic acid dehydratase [Acidobacteria bacterium RIFCSPLOWO2_02_FULL_61_28]|nr:MAG: delta-aminolevulinic acid dehydratase [Acidobacteria bacterium RIFCSPLOWO2_02_FULL_61_28]
MSFPTTRLRRLRRSELLRSFVQETRLSAKNFIYPLFVGPGSGVKREIASMPGNYQFSVDRVGEECREVADLGVPAVLLFGIPETKDERGSSAYGDDCIVAQAVRAIRQAVGEKLLILCDVCLCEYTSHGHCGVLKGQEVDNDATLDLLAEESLSYARAGADMVAPSDMMDGRVRAIRRALDGASLSHVSILAYSAKYASVFYGPFREAADSAPQFGDRRSYQMDPSNQREALREIALDIEEGADMVMIKPAMPYLDVICRARQEFPIPIAAYQVSGEYSMIVAAAQRGWIDRERAMMETLTAIRRAGADVILTYFAKDAARLLAC